MRLAAAAGAMALVMTACGSSGTDNSGEAQTQAESQKAGQETAAQNQEARLFPYPRQNRQYRRENLSPRTRM